MTLASFTDANNHLDENKIGFANAHDAEEISLSVDRYVRGRLAGVYGPQVLTWSVDPGVDEVIPPELVTEVCSMLMAAELYAQKYAEETDIINVHARNLKRDAEKLLDLLVGGDLVLVEADIVSGTAFSQADFWPNDTTAENATTPDPKFTMDMVL